jgi:hypothetical protein
MLPPKKDSKRSNGFVCMDSHSLLIVRLFLVTKTVG